MAKKVKKRPLAAVAAAAAPPKVNPFEMGKSRRHFDVLGRRTGGKTGVTKNLIKARSDAVAKVREHIKAPDAGMYLYAPECAHGCVWTAHVISRLVISCMTGRTRRLP
jgi:hypothetical protein